VGNFQGGIPTPPIKYSLPLTTAATGDADDDNDDTLRPASVFHLLAMSDSVSRQSTRVTSL